MTAKMYVVLLSSCATPGSILPFIAPGSLSAQGVLQMKLRVVLCVCVGFCFFVFFFALIFFCTPIVNFTIELLTKNCITLGDLA